jgi:hypothetical protein
MDLLMAYGPTLLVNIGFDANYKQDANPLQIPQSAIQGVRALVDTGATECCIDDQLAVQIKLPVIDRRKISGVGGAHDVNVYLAQIHVPSLAFTMYGAFAGVNLAAGGQMHQALMGRTFLGTFTMTYNGITGDVELTS